MKIITTLHLSFFLLLLAACGNNEQQQTKTTSTAPGIDSTATVKKEKLTYKEAYDKALTLWKVPLEEKDVHTSFGNAHVIICGRSNAEPLVLLHGMNASSTMWYPNIKELSAQYRIYAIDFLLEPGKSLCEKGINSTEQIIDWYYEIFDQLHLQKFNIAGASRGGWLAVNIALRETSRVRKMILLSPAQTFIWIKPQMKILSNITYTISPKRKRLRSILETMTFNVDNIQQVYINQYYIATKEANINKCILQMTPFSDEKLRSLKIPVLLLIGDNDIINNDKSIERAKKLIPDVQAETIKNAGHFLSIDQSELVNKKILDFLTVRDPLIVRSK